MKAVASAVHRVVPSDAEIGIAYCVAASVQQLQQLALQKTDVRKIFGARGGRVLCGQFRVGGLDLLLLGAL